MRAPRQRCLIEGCDRLEELASGRSTGGLCAGHRYRKRFGLPLEAPLHEGLARRRSPLAALLEAALALAEVDAVDDVSYSRALGRLTYAARRYVERRVRKAPSK